MVGFKTMGEAAVKRHPELDPWRHEELDPLCLL
jgi:hypothetical protein